jgi:hypothetical protein
MLNLRKVILVTVMMVKLTDAVSVAFASDAQGAAKGGRPRPSGSGSSRPRPSWCLMKWKSRMRVPAKPTLSPKAI